MARTDVLACQKIFEILIQLYSFFLAGHYNILSLSTAPMVAAAHAHVGVQVADYHVEDFRSFFFGRECSSFDHEADGGAPHQAMPPPPLETRCLNRYPYNEYHPR